MEINITVQINEVPNISAEIFEGRVILRPCYLEYSVEILMFWFFKIKEL